MGGGGGGISTRLNRFGTIADIGSAFILVFGFL